MTTAPAVHPETAQHTARYSVATPRNPSVEKITEGDGKLNARGENASRTNSHPT